MALTYCYVVAEIFQAMPLTPGNGACELYSRSG